MGMDETTWRLLRSEQKGRSKKWWVWAQRVDNAVHYRFDSSRSSDIQVANCWAHARREALPFEAHPRAARVLRVIQRMYRLEWMAKQRGLSPPELLRWRQRKTRPLLHVLFRWMATLEIPSTSDLRPALQYIIK